MWPKWKDIPMVYTVFSAPNYCGSYNNLGAILTIEVIYYKFRNLSSVSVNSNSQILNITSLKNSMHSIFR